MGLMSDPHIEAAESTTTLMIAVANGRVCLQDFGRWIATYNPSRVSELPEHMRTPLSEAERNQVSMQMVIGPPGSTRPDWNPDGPGGDFKERKLTAPWSNTFGGREREN
jgi:hypothetical protein